MLAQYGIVPYIAQPEQAKPSKSAAEWKAQAPLMSGKFGEDLLAFLLPLVEHLHEANKVDKRPLKTLVQAVEAIVAFREQAHGFPRDAQRVRSKRVVKRVGGVYIDAYRYRGDWSVEHHRGAIKKWTAVPL